MLTNPTRRLAAIALVSLMSIPLASCSNDDKPLSKAAFIKQLNALCKERDEKLAFLDEVNIFNPEDGAAALRKSEAPIRAFVRDFQELEPPKDAEEVVDDWAGSADDILAKIDGMVAAGEAGELKTYSQRLLHFFKSTDSIDMAMHEYGTEDCYDEDDAMPPAQEPEPGATPYSVAAMEYTFEVPAVAAGKAAFTLRNEGEEIHIFGFGKLNDGVTFEQVRAAAAGDEFDPSQLFGEEVGPTAPTAPDGSAVLNADMSPGTYVAFCFIPSPDGVPHIQKGMLVPFDVT